jgi:hypothetical protein
MHVSHGFHRLQMCGFEELDLTRTRLLSTPPDQERSGVGSFERGDEERFG